MEKINENKLKEKRKYRRFHINDFMIAFLRPAMKNLGLIMDISKGGMAVKYISSENVAKNLLEVDIFLPQNLAVSMIPRLVIIGVPCLAIYDIRHEDPQDAINELCTRICGIKFGNLSKEQRQELDCLLQEICSNEQQ